MASEEKRGGREISLCAGRPLRRSEAGRKSRPAPFEMTGEWWRRNEAKGRVMRETCGSFPTRSESSIFRARREEARGVSRYKSPGWPGRNHRDAPIGVPDKIGAGGVNAMHACRETKTCFAARQKGDARKSKLAIGNPELEKRREVSEAVRR